MDLDSTKYTAWVLASVIPAMLYLQRFVAGKWLKLFSQWPREIGEQKNVLAGSLDDQHKHGAQALHTAGLISVSKSAGWPLQPLAAGTGHRAPGTGHRIPRCRGNRRGEYGAALVDDLGPAVSPQYTLPGFIPWGSGQRTAKISG
ncbi:hypothetical protein RRG08_030074 [Elysia crispata]|uniref:Uncharacterized protein n=1 Tax=Elysia crispata TaxID=231223 RepID=A0AAE0ZRG0_9GAST|nr:hypothetical protein RRG08_030074 [Elysia crispata]